METSDLCKIFSDQGLEPDLQNKTPDKRYMKNCKADNLKLDVHEPQKYSRKSKFSYTSAEQI